MDTKHQRFLPLLVLPLAAASWALTPYLGIVHTASLWTPWVFGAMVALKGGSPTSNLTYQSWVLGAAAPFLGTFVGVCIGWVLVAASNSTTASGLFPLSVAAVVTVFAQRFPLSRRLAAPALNDTAVGAAQDIGLAYAVHGVEPCDVLVAMDGDRVFYVPPARRAYDNALYTALEWAAARTNQRNIGRHWPSSWERHSRMDAITRQSAQMLHLVNGRWGANRPSLSPTLPSAHVLMAAAHAHAQKGSKHTTR